MATTATLTARVGLEGADTATSELRGLENQADRTETATENLERETRELTESLQAQSRASRTSSRAIGDLGNSISSAIGSVSLLTGGIIGVGAGLIALALNVGSLKSELIILADLSHTSVQEFQKLSTAFKTVNVESDKTADILKDVNDKFGEFALTGGGEFKDIFEKVLKPLGKTKKELTELGPGGILLAVAEGLEHIGSDGKEATFILEALASDASLLLPLLKNNGKQLKTISLAIEEKGLLLTDNEVQALRNANTELAKMESLFSNVFIKTKGVLAEFLFGDDFPETFEGINDEIEALQVKIKDLQTEDGFLGDSKDILRAQLRIGDLINARFKLLEVERLARKEAEQAAFVEEVGIKRRAAEFEAIRKAEQEKIALKREIDEQRITDELNLREEEDTNELIRREKQLDQERDAAQKRFDLILKLNDTERDAIGRRRAERLKDLQADFDKQLIAFKDFHQARAEIDRNARIAFEKLDKKAADVKTAETEKLIGKITGLMQSGNEELFRIGQAAALANAVVETASAISKALASSAPPLNFLFAAAAGAAGAAQVAAIASASPPSARQQGGQFQAGQQLVVGEQGPELVEFGNGGRIADSRETSQMMRNDTVVPEIVIINQTSEEISEPDVTIDEDERVIILIRNTVSSDLENSNSRISKSLGRSTTTARQF